MILSAGSTGALPLLLGGCALLAYAVAVVPAQRAGRAAVGAFMAGVVAHVAMLLTEIGSLGLGGGMVRLGFGPVLSLTVCLTLAVHAFDGRLLPAPAVRRPLAVAGIGAVALGMIFPGEARVLGSAWAPLHWLLGVGSYGLFGAALLHAVLLDGAERRLRARRGLPSTTSGVPLLQLERITFRFVGAGFAVLSVAMLLGIAGRHWRGWRGQQATRWLYAGVLVLLLAYVGSRFVMEVLLQRSAAA